MKNKNEIRKEMEALVDTIFEELETIAEGKENKEVINAMKNTNISEQLIDTIFEDLDKEEVKNKKENKKEKKEMKNDNSWLTGNSPVKENHYGKESRKKVTNKIVKIGSSMMDITIENIGGRVEYTIHHKQKDNGVINLHIFSDQFEDMYIKIKENDEVEGGIEYKSIKIKNDTNKVDYDKEYVIVDNNIVIPIDLLINPIFDFYVQNKKIRKANVLYTEGNIKIKGDKITLYANMGNGSILVDPRGLTIDEINDLVKIDDDNKMASAKIGRAHV